MAAENEGAQYTEPSDERWAAVRAQPRSFFRAPLCTDLSRLDTDVAFLGVPFDQGTLGRPGARFGPDAVRDAPRSYSYADPYGAQRDAEGIFDVDAGHELLRGVTMADCGDVTVVPADVVGNFKKLTEAVEKIAERGAFPRGDRRRPLHHVSGGEGAIQVRQGQHHPLRCPPRLYP